MEPKTVLVIEDSPYLAESLHDMLELKGYRALIAPNGRAGVATALREEPDMILLDIRLPDISGYDVYNAIRKSDWGKTARISILTASEATDTIAKNISIPIAHILFKPNSSVIDILNHINDRLLENVTIQKNPS